MISTLLALYFLHDIDIVFMKNNSKIKEYKETPMGLILN